MFNEFILPSEQEGFIHRMRDIIRRAEALMRCSEPLGPVDALRLPYLSGVGMLSGSQVSARVCVCVWRSVCVCVEECVCALVQLPFFLTSMVKCKKHKNT